jgi:hypothetical protein
MLDQKTLNWRTPKAVDGRRYPPHLRSYEVFDAQLTPLVARMQPATFDDLSVHIEDPRALAALPRWLASAEWRSIVRRQSAQSRGRRTYVLGPRAKVRSPGVKAGPPRAKARPARAA